MEAGSISDAKMQRFKHNDINQLSTILTKHSDVNNKLVISEGVFSMDGDKAPVTQLKASCDEHDAWLMIDDAHGLGVLGKEGKGSVVAQNMANSDVNIYMATFGKALGVGGAFVSGSEELIEYITNFSKPYIYTTGLPPAMVYCIGEAASLAEKQQWRRDHLEALIAHFKSEAARYNIPLMGSDTAIQPVMIGDSETALTVSNTLKSKGIWTTAIRPPTVLQIRQDCELH